MNYIELVKASKTYMDKNIKVAILADSATQHLKTALKGYGNIEGFGLDIFDADYNQIEFQIYNPNSELYEHKPEYVIIFMCVQKLYEAFCNSEEQMEFADEIISRIKNYHRVILDNIDTKIIQLLFVEDDDKTFGNYGLGLQNSFIYQLKKINFGVMNLASENRALNCIDLNYICNQRGKKSFFDEVQYCNSKLAIGLECLPDVAGNIISIIKAQKGKIKKCIILDLDNTLWGGVIGDDGLDGIELGELGIGHAFYELQLWLKQLKQRGIILCVCSKNNESTAKEPFEKHPDMVLHLEDIAMFVANWDDKASNIKYIQQTINIGMDSIVFLDDNPFERNIVKEMIPDITVPELPEDPALYVSYLKSLNLFETASYSTNDQERTKQYQEEVGRSELQKKILDINEYLISLEMEGVAECFIPFYFPRIAQLTQRSNQFNLRTIRYSEADIERIAKDDKYITLYFTLKDKFGDYGLVSVVIMEKRNDIAFIDTWLMSCRVLKRGMEEFVANAVVEAAKKYGMKKIVGEYIETAKNLMVKDMYRNLGYTDIGNNQYELIVENYVPKNNFINKVEEN